MRYRHDKGATPKKPLTPAAIEMLRELLKVGAVRRDPAKVARIEALLAGAPEPEKEPDGWL